MSVPETRRRGAQREQRATKRRADSREGAIASLQMLCNRPQWIGITIIQPSSLISGPRRAPAGPGSVHVTLHAAVVGAWFVPGQVLWSIVATRLHAWTADWSI